MVLQADPLAPLKTDRWDVERPGFTEIDLVSHLGSDASGDCCHSLNLTDIHTTWTETRAVLGKGQEGVRQALDEMRQALPFLLEVLWFGVHQRPSLSVLPTAADSVHPRPTL